MKAFGKGVLKLGGAAFLAGGAIWLGSPPFLLFLINAEHLELDSR